MTLRVLHIFGQLRPGGPVQSLIAAVRRNPADGVRHHIASLKPADRHAARQAAAVGITGTSAPGSRNLETLLTEADVVQVHFWNDPDIHAFLAADLVPMRLLLWCHVNGNSPPHVIPAYATGRSDFIIVTARSSLGLASIRHVQPDRICFVQSIADFHRIEGVIPTSHEGINVGYVGNIGFAKLHEGFLHMCAAVDVPSVRFLLCGDGPSVKQLVSQAAELGVHVELFGYMEEIASFLAELDIFGYPLTPTTSATAELALQEAMYAGVPPVVFNHAGPGELVVNGKTGLTVSSEEEYVAAIEWLCRNPEARKKIGANAARAIRSLAAHAKAPGDIYEGMMQRPKRFRGRVADQPPCVGARLLVKSLDTMDECFSNSLMAANEEEAVEAELRIAGTSADMREVVLQYRARYPADPALRVWSGLIMKARGRAALAASEFHAAISLGLDRPRIRSYEREARQGLSD